MLEITKGKMNSALKVVVYGPEGIGKSTFAAQAPNPLFIDTEGSTKHMDVARFPKPTSWTMLLSEVQEVKNNPSLCGTLALDTADWAEQLCADELCAKQQKTGIEDFGYGKGYVYLAESFGKLLNLLEEVVERGVNVVITAHAKMRKFEQPDEIGAYDRWELKLGKNTAPLVKEWADMLLFANYKTYVLNVDGQGAEKGKNKVQGGKRVMYTTHNPCWDAKNRQGLQDELTFSFLEIAHCFNATASNVTQQNAETKNSSAAAVVEEQAKREMPVPTEAPKMQAVTVEQADPYHDIPKPVHDLMQARGIVESEIRSIVAQKGYFPYETPIRNYGDEFINGWVIACWEKIAEAIESEPDRLPF